MNVYQSGERKLKNITFSAEVKKSVELTSAPSFAFMMWTGNISLQLSPVMNTTATELHTRSVLLLTDMLAVSDIDFPA